MGELIGAGRLCVATPLLEDPNFARAVVAVIEHDDSGSLGLVLNRPTQADSREPLPDWSDLVGSPPVVFVGGPVQAEVAVGLARLAGPVDHEGWMPILDDIGLIDLSHPPGSYGQRITEIRIFAGYAGWTEGQLAVEIGEPAWFVVDSLPDDLFCREPETLWRDVLRRQRHDLALYAHYPVDVSTN